MRDYNNTLSWLPSGYQWLVALATVALFLSPIIDSPSVSGQDLPVDAENAGFHTSLSYLLSRFESVNLLDGRLTIHIPLLSYPQRGTLPPLEIFITASSSVTSTFTSQCLEHSSKTTTAGGGYPDVEISPSWTPGFHFYGEIETYPTCTPPPEYEEYTVNSADGSQIILGNLSGASSSTFTATDGTVLYDSSTGLLVDSQGNQYTIGPFEYGSNNMPPIGDPDMRIQDPNGNAIVRTNLLSAPSFAGYWTDSVGRVIPDINKPGNGNPTETFPGSQTGCFSQSYPGPNGGTVPFAFCYSTGVLYKVTLPNNTTWQFTQTGNNLSTVTTPTGATITYQWTSVSPCGFPYSLGTDTLSISDSAIKSISVDLNDGSPAKLWKYSYSDSYGNAVTTVTDPNGNDTVHTFTPSSGSQNCSLFETKTQFYQGSSTNGGTLLKTVTTSYYDGGPNYLDYWISDDINVFPKTETTTWSNGLASQTTFAYDSSGEGTFYAQSSPYGTGTFPIVYGDPVQKTESDYGNNAPGAVLRTTNTSYYWQSNSSYQNASLIKLPCLTTIYGSGSVPSQTGCLSPPVQANQLSQVSYGYDENNGSPQGTFGNRTSISQWLSAGSPVVSHTVYDAQGMPTTKIDPLGNTTQITYDSSGLFPKQIQYPTTANGVQHIIHYSYDLNTGFVLSEEDENGKTTSYTPDSMRRIIGVSYPDGGSETYSYFDTTPNPSYTLTKSINPAETYTEKVVFDALDRKIHSYINSDPMGTDEVDITYDGVGNVESISNPYRSTSDSTYGVTTFSYDALGRKVLKQSQDGVSKVYWCYNGIADTGVGQPNCAAQICNGNPASRVDFTGENGNHWQRCSDGLGRLTGVIEDASGAKLQTDYQYDALGNLTRVDQWGGAYGSSGDRVRLFLYDSLSRLINSCDPESISPGLTCSQSGPWSDVYSYDPDSNVQSKMDARGITTTYSYDALSRLISKVYSSNAPAGSLASCYQFDTATNGNGRLGSEWTQTGSCPASLPAAPGYQSLRVIGAYDAMGRVATEQQCVLGFCTSAAPPPAPAPNCTALPAASGLSYCYDLNGNLTAYSNGLNSTAYAGQSILFSQDFDGAARLSSVSSSLNRTQLPPNLFTVNPSNGYTPLGTLENWNLGSNLNVNKTYDSRLRVKSETATQQ